jgi:hypothetical protein
MNITNLSYSNSAGVLFAQNHWGIYLCNYPDNGSILRVYSDVNGVISIASDEIKKAAKWISLISPEIRYLQEKAYCLRLYSALRTYC